MYSICRQAYMMIMKCQLYVVRVCLPIRYPKSWQLSENIGTKICYPANLGRYPKILARKSVIQQILAVIKHSVPHDMSVMFHPKLLDTLIARPTIAPGSPFLQCIHCILQCSAQSLGILVGLTFCDSACIANA